MPVIALATRSQHVDFAYDQVVRPHRSYRPSGGLPRGKPRTRHMWICLQLSGASVVDNGGVKGSLNLTLHCILFIMTCFIASLSLNLTLYCILFIITCFIANPSINLTLYCILFIITCFIADPPLNITPHCILFIMTCFIANPFLIPTLCCILFIITCFIASGQFNSCSYNECE